MLVMTIVGSGSVTVLHAQARPGTVCEIPPPPREAAISSAQHKVVPACVDSLRAALNAGEFGKALQINFGATYNPKLVNWVVYVRRDGTVRQSVVKFGRPTHLLRTEKYAYVAVFLEEPPTRDSTNAEWPALELSRRSIDFSREAFTSIMVALFSAGRLQGGAEPARTVADLDRQVRLRRISEDTINTLWMGSARLELGENTDVQLSLNAMGREQLSGALTRIYTTVNNAKSMRSELGITVGSSLGPPIVQDESGGTTVKAGAQSNVYLSAYVNILRPHPPRQRKSVGIVAGTNITRGNLLDEILTGVGFGRLMGDAGAVVGVIWQQINTTTINPEGGPSSTEQRRVPRLFLGFDLRI